MMEDLYGIEELEENMLVMMDWFRIQKVEVVL